MGRRSYFSCEPLVPFDRARSQVPKRQAYLVTKPTHPRTLWLLHNIKAAGARISVCSQDRRTRMRVPCSSAAATATPGKLTSIPDSGHPQMSTALGWFPAAVSARP
jgi:hypothetical protein